MGIKDYAEKEIARALEVIREEVKEAEEKIFGTNKVEVVLRISFGGKEGLPTVLAESVDFKHELGSLASDLRQAVKSFNCPIAEATVDIINERKRI